MLNDSEKDLGRERIRRRGFTCQGDDVTRTWILVGSRVGLLRFRDLLLAYVADLAMNQISEHKHYGALEVMTWTTAGFDHHAIRGSLLDLRRLASFVEAKLADARQAGQFQFEKVRILRAEARAARVPAEVMQLVIVAGKIQLADGLTVGGRTWIDIDQAHGVAFPVFAGVQQADVSDMLRRGLHGHTR
jgi:hypothetical protein